MKLQIIVGRFHILNFGRVNLVRYVNLMQKYDAFVYQLPNTDIYGQILTMVYKNNKWLLTPHGEFHDPETLLTYKECRTSSHLWWLQSTLLTLTSSPQWALVFLVKRNSRLKSVSAMTYPVMNEFSFSNLQNFS